MKRLLAAVTAATLLHAGPAYADDGFKAGVVAPKHPNRAIPAVLQRIRGCESGDGPSSPGNYRAADPRSTATGAYSVLRGTWRSWSKAYGSDVGAPRYSRAKDAPAWVQDTVAVRAFNAQGTRPWNASRRCWR